MAALKDGFYYVHLKVGKDCNGSPKCLQEMDAFYALLQTKGFAPKGIVTGVSRGGFYAWRFSAKFPERVCGIYGDAPCCDFKSYPTYLIGSKTCGFKPDQYDLICRLYGFTSLAEFVNFRGNPLDWETLKSVAAAKIPVLHVVGGADTVVPPEYNTFILERRFRSLGGAIEVIVKPECEHHPHGLDDPAPILEFFRRAIRSDSLRTISISSVPIAAPVLVVNEDNSAYFSQRKYGGRLDEAGLRDYVRELAAGGQVTHFFMCPNAMCANVESKVMTTTWDAIRRPGVKVRPWQHGVALVHAAGIDPYAVWIDECRKAGVSPWLSVRMNDVHFVSDPKDAMHSEFWLNHPEFRRASKLSKNWGDLALDYSHKEVRDYIVGFISELLARYDVDGIELDWMRFPYHLPPGHEAESSAFLNEVVSVVRTQADAAARRLAHPVRLGVRVPTRPSAARAMGLDIATWCAAGWVDWVVPCNFFESVDFNLPFAEWKQLVAVSKKPVMVVPGLDNGVTEKGKRRPLIFGEYAAFAERMYAEGAEGIYIFNIFDLPKEAGTRAALLEKGLPKASVAAWSEGITLPSHHD